MQSSTSIYKSMQLSPTRLFAMIFILEKAPFIITKKFTTTKKKLESAPFLVAIIFLAAN